MKLLLFTYITKLYSWKTGEPAKIISTNKIASYSINTDEPVIFLCTSGSYLKYKRIKVVFVELGAKMVA